MRPKINLETKQKKIISISIAFFSVAVIFGNCGQSFSLLDGATSDVHISNTLEKEASFDMENNVRLQTANQTLLTYANLTKMEVTTEMMNEYQTVSALLVDSTSLLRVNAPLFTGSARLAAVTCNAVINREKVMAAANRRLFKSVDFNQAIDTHAEAALIQNWNQMARLFWARDLSASEAAGLTAYRAQYLQSLVAGDNKVSLTQELSLGVCTAMLSSFDSITL